MTGEEWKRQLRAMDLQNQSKDLIVEFLRKHLDDDLIFTNVDNTRSWLQEIYPEVMDESEHDEEVIAAFVAGVLWVMINAHDLGIRWIYTLPALTDEDDN